MINSLLVTVYWWFLLFTLGLIFFPFTQKLFEKFFDRGYLFSKAIALIFLSWPIFLLGHLKIIPFTQGSILIFLILALILAIVFRKRKKVFLTKKLAGKIVKEEALFLIALLFWSYLRGLKPDISGLEKFMDFGFVKSLVNSRFLPPADMWFAGETINYYYYGHFLTALLTKLSGLSPTITYNLMIATLFALTTTEVFSLTANLTAKISQKTKLIISAGLISALIVGLASNLHTPYYVYKNGPEKYWYPDATRYIGYNPPTHDKTIHEFPAYSFIVSDLHGHVLSLPLVILFIALTWSLLTEKTKAKNRPKIATLGLTLGVIYMTNSWDFPIYLLLLGVSLLIQELTNLKKPSVALIFKIFTKIAPVILAVIILSLLVSLPFNLNFKQIAQGIGLVKTKTPLFQLFILWGAFSFWAASFLIFLKLFSPKKTADYFTLSLIITAFILIALPEFIYVKDIYATDFYRANTMFKFTFQAYLMLTIASGYIVARISQALKTIITKTAFLLTSSFIIASLLIYPAFSIPGFYGSIEPKNFQGLVGLNFLAQRYPEDYQAIIWIEKNLPQSAIILEAAGDSYTDYGRVSAFTGRPTIQGWIVHEWLWRGGYDLPAKRASQVEQIYQSADPKTAQKLLQEYAVDYIFFGALEKEKYPEATIEKLSLLGEPIFRAGETVIFEVEKP